MNEENEWISHALSESQHEEDLKGGSFSQEGGEEATGPKPSPGFKVKVSWRDPDLPFSSHQKGEEDQASWGGSLAGPRTPYSWSHDFIADHLVWKIRIERVALYAQYVAFWHGNNLG